MTQHPLISETCFAKLKSASGAEFTLCYEIDDSV